MPEQHTTDDYIRAFRDWGTPRQISRLLGWATPEEWEEIRREAGSPAEVLEAIRTSKQLARRAAFWVSARSMIFQSAAWIVGVSGGLAVLKGMFPNLFDWWRP